MTIGCVVPVGCPIHQHWSATIDHFGGCQRFLGYGSEDTCVLILLSDHELRQFMFQQHVVHWGKARTSPGEGGREGREGGEGGGR